MREVTLLSHRRLEALEDLVDGIYVSCGAPIYEDEEADLDRATATALAQLMELEEQAQSLAREVASYHRIRTENL
jgi:hypothetical protein